MPPSRFPIPQGDSVTENFCGLCALSVAVVSHHAFLPSGPNVAETRCDRIMDA